MFDYFDKIINEFFNKTEKNQYKKSTKKRGRRKVNFTEKDCEVTYDLEWLFKMNMPGEYIDYIEL